MSNINASLPQFMLSHDMTDKYFSQREAAITIAAMIRVIFLCWCTAVGTGHLFIFHKVCLQTMWAHKLNCFINKSPYKTCLMLLILLDLLVVFLMTATLVVGDGEIKVIDNLFISNLQNLLPIGWPWRTFYAFCNVANFAVNIQMLLWHWREGKHQVKGPDVEITW